MKINQYLKTHKIPLVAFARKAGIAFSNLYAYMNGEATPRQRTAMLIVKASNGEITLLDLIHKDYDMDKEGEVTVGEAAKYRNVCEAQIRILIRLGVLKAVKRNRTWRIKKKDLIDYENKRKALIKLREQNYTGK